MGTFARCRKLKRWWLRLIVVLIGLCLGASAAELALRLIGISYPAAYAVHEHCGSTLQPGFEGVWSQEGRSRFRVNSFGFRDREPAVAKPTGTVRIAVLGDSYIEALQVSEDEMFARVLERRLNSDRQAVGAPIEVLSFGIAGWGTGQELLALRHIVWQFDPDVIVLAFLAANDVRNNSKALEPVQCRPFFELVDDELQLDRSFLAHSDYQRAQAPATLWKNAVINRCRLIQLWRHVRDSRQANVGVRTGADASGLEAGLEAEALREPTTAEWRAAWTLTDRLLIEMANEVHNRERAFFVMPIPSGVQVDPDPQRREQLIAKWQVEDLDYAERRVTALGAEHGFQVIPLAERLRRFAESQQQHLHGFANTQLGIGHWNAAGHEQAALFAAEALREWIHRAQPSNESR